MRPNTRTHVDTLHAVIALVARLLTFLPEVARPTRAGPRHRIAGPLVQAVAGLGAVFPVRSEWAGEGALLTLPS